MSYEEKVADDFAEMHDEMCESMGLKEKPDFMKHMEDLIRAGKINLDGPRFMVCGPNAIKFLKITGDKK